LPHHYTAFGLCIASEIACPELLPGTEAPPDLTICCGIVPRELDGETILKGPDWKAYFGMDSTAQRIWKLIAQPCQVADLCAQLTAEYAVDERT
jgi:hypothetical protein